MRKITSFLYSNVLPQTIFPCNTKKWISGITITDQLVNALAMKNLDGLLKSVFHTPRTQPSPRTAALTAILLTSLKNSICA